VKNTNDGGAMAFAVFPNPSSKDISIELQDSLANEIEPDEPIQIKVIDRNSKEVMDVVLETDTRKFPVTKLSPDIYFLIVSYKNLVFKKSIIINR